MYLIKKLSTKEEFCEFGDIVVNAYPGFGIDTKEQKDNLINNAMKTQEESPNVKFYGAFRGEELLGGMRYHNFNMNLLSTKIKAGGVGLVAVHFLHKKEKIAKAIVKDFIEHFKSEGAPMVMLYPFRTDFYKNMGFGFGTSMNQYKVKPSNLPKGNSKDHIVFVNEERLHRLTECYNRVYEKTNGLLERYKKEFLAYINSPKFRIAAYEENDRIQGYIIFEFKPYEEKSSLINDMVIKELVFENTESLSELLTFLNSEDDQISNIIFNIQDEDFRFLLDNPTDGSLNMFVPVYHQCSLQGTGIMYRVTDIKELFVQLREHNFNNENCKLKLTISDSFIEENNGSFIINFKDGYPAFSKEEEFDVEVAMDIADFSSLITCAVSFKALYKYGRASISREELVDKINNIFATDEKPVCLTVF